MRVHLATIGFALVCASCGAATDEPRGPAGSVESWLAQNRRVADALVWDAGDGRGPRPYASWSSADRAALEVVVEQARTGATPTLADPPVNVVASKIPDDAPAATAITSTDARGLYFGYVGRSLMLEMTHALPWSIIQYDSLDLAVLLDSRSFFRWQSNVAGTGVAAYAIYDDTAIANAVNDPNKADGWVVPAPPKVVLQFLSANNMIAGDRLTTITRLLEWERVNMVHFVGDFTAGSTFFSWQYRGAPPVSRIISGTTTPATGPTPSFFAHFTAGCPGTTMFMMHVLRAVNIPVRYVVHEQHALPYFATEGKALDHADNPYTASWTPSTPRLDVSELFLDQPTYTAWFSPSLSPSQRLNNIGRRPIELSVKYLTTRVLLNRCQDIAQGITSHAASKVYREVSRIYSLGDLEAMDLWTKIDAKILAAGGCVNIRT